MTEQPRRGKWRWLRHVAWVLGANLALVLAAGIVFFEVVQEIRCSADWPSGESMRLPAVRRKFAVCPIRWLFVAGFCKGPGDHGKEPAGPNHFLPPKKSRRTPNRFRSGDARFRSPT